MLNQEAELKLLRNHFKTLSQADCSGRSLAVLYMEALESKEAEIEKLTKERDKAISANDALKERIRALEAENEKLKRSQTNYNYSNGAVHEDNRKIVQVVSPDSPTMSIAAAQ